LFVYFKPAEQHFLRDEKGVYYEDLYPLISFLPRYANDGGPNDQKLPLWDDDFHASNRAIDMPTTELGRVREDSEDSMRRRDVEKVAEVATTPAEPRLKPARLPPVQTVYDYVPLFRLFRWIARTISRRARAKQLAAGIKPKRRIYEDVVESYIPLEILLFLSK
jgi:hypothetical protein